MNTSPPPKPIYELHDIIKELLESGRVSDIQVQSKGMKAVVTLSISFNMDPLLADRIDPPVDWQERIEGYIAEYLGRNHLIFKPLNRKHKRLLVQKLYKQGAFHYKYAADFIAYKLQISKATVYNYLK